MQNEVMPEVMPEVEIEIMRDMFYFLRDHNDPPANEAPGAVDFWMQTVRDMSDLCRKWGNHMLAKQVLVGMACYLEEKGRAKGVVA